MLYTQIPFSLPVLFISYAPFLVSKLGCYIFDEEARDVEARASVPLLAGQYGKMCRLYKHVYLDS